MKSFKEYFLESKEDGKYLDLPKYMSEPWLSPYTPKEEKARIKSEYKAYKESVKKIDEENFEILIDKFLKFIESREGKNNFLLNSSNSKFNVYLNKDKGEEYKDYFDEIEEYVAMARVVLESDKMNLSALGDKTRKKDASAWDKDRNKLLRFWDGERQFSVSLYNLLAHLAQAYNIDIPKFKNEFADLFTPSHQERLDHMRERSGGRMWSDATYYKKSDKAYAEFEKDAEKVKKARAKFKDTETYKNIMKILDTVEDDLKAADENYTKFEERFKSERAASKKNKEIADAIVEVTDKVNDIVAKEFHNPDEVSFYINRLYQAVAIAYLESDKQFPDIEVSNKSTSSWLAGLRHKATFTVKGKNGKDYGSITMEDKGLPSGDGFGPWD